MCSREAEKRTSVSPLLEAAEVRLAPLMSAQEVSNTMLGYATRRRSPGERARSALEVEPGK